MRVCCFLIASILVATLSFSPALSGELASDLAEKVQTSSPNDLISVWISLGRVESVEKLKASAAPTAQTRHARHHAISQRLKETHRDSQAPVISELNRLRKLGKSINIQPYWITNVIAAEIQSSELEQLATRPEIAKIYLVPQASLIAPIDDDNTPMSDPMADSIAPHLSYIKADEAWGAGFTGAGRLVCSFDTGVDGAHPALANSWKGLDGDSAAAWFDPAYEESFPKQYTTITTTNHGTHTMGSMVGRDTDTGYTVGVAPEAKWISAAVVDIPGTTQLSAFQWAADPDDNPNTIDDVPDVINHSWGFYKNVDGITIIECESLFYDLIDNVEALGIVNIFAGGNWYWANTIHNPGNGDRDSLDCFAVGNLDITAVTPTRNYSSSQGPSTCRGGIKPNVMAPGTNISSCISSNRYATMSGTSMAAPQVAGLVALLRQKNPNATVNEIKEAILASTQADASWGTLPNNEYGWGAIDCMAALDYLSDNLSDPTTLHIADYSHPTITPGDTVGGNITILNTGQSVTNVFGQLTSSDPNLTVLNGFVSFGTIPLNGSSSSSGVIEVIVSESVYEGSMLSLDLKLTGDGLDTTLVLYYQLGTHATMGVATHTTASIEFTLSNYGILGLGSQSMFRAGGLGFSYENSPNSLWEGGVMIGTSPTQVASGIHSFIDRPEMDFKPAPYGEMVFLEPGRSGAQESISAFTDAWATNPTGVTIRQHSFSYDFPDDKFIILRYILENHTASAINNLLFGLLLDWDLPSAINGSNAGGYDESSGILWQAYNNGSALSAFRGMKMIQGTLSGALIESATDILYIRLWSGDGYTDAEKFASLSAGIPVDDPYENAQDDLFQMMNFGPYNLAPGEIDSLTIAILAGHTFAELVDAGALAMLVPTDVDETTNESLPTDFVLHQNYPNPFNPTTTIRFDLPKASDYRLQIYNVLGQMVHDISGKASPGRVVVEWDGKTAASGIYFYKVTAGEFSDSKKMLLLK